MFETKLLTIISYANTDFRIIRKCHNESKEFIDSITNEELKQMLEYMLLVSKDIEDCCNYTFTFYVRGHYVRYTVWNTIHCINGYDVRLKSALNKNLYNCRYGEYREIITEDKQLSLF